MNHEQAIEDLERLARWVVRVDAVTGRWFVDAISNSYSATICTTPCKQHTTLLDQPATGMWVRVR
jgi:hypothetical protein